jgi:hypothetical protein
MSQFGKELRMYADRGLRSASDWLSRGRQVMGDVQPRSDAISRGETIALFSRDQTRPYVAPPRGDPARTAAPHVAKAATTTAATTSL